MDSQRKFKRVLLKISGEALMGDGAYGIDVGTVDRIAGEVRQAMENGFELCLVIGGGNIFRGLSGAAGGMDRSADYMAAGYGDECPWRKMPLSARISQPACSQRFTTTVCSRISVVAPFVIWKGRVVIFAAGTGNPFLRRIQPQLRAAEMNCDALMKGTNVDGVYVRP